MATSTATQSKIVHEWLVIDASDKVLGRFASKLANKLQGKDKPEYSPHQDHGAHIIVLNADKVRVTGKKLDQKEYFRHSTHTGHPKFRTLRTQMAMDSRKAIFLAVKGMLSNSPLNRAIIRKLHIYKGATHPHTAQKPQELA